MNKSLMVAQTFGLSILIFGSFFLIKVFPPIWYLFVPPLYALVSLLGNDRVKHDGVLMLMSFYLYSLLLAGMVIMTVHLIRWIRCKRKARFFAAQAAGRAASDRRED